MSNFIVSIVSINIQGGDFAYSDGTGVTYGVCINTTINHDMHQCHPYGALWSLNRYFLIKHFKMINKEETLCRCTTFGCNDCF